MQFPPFMQFPQLEQMSFLKSARDFFCTRFTFNQSVKPDVDDRIGGKTFGIRSNVQSEMVTKPYRAFYESTTLFRYL